ncbi:MAG: LysE family translocator [Bermanella sp.]
MELFLVYIFTCFLIIATPGPSAFLMMQHAASNGINKCLYNSLGSILASSILIIMALAGASFFIGTVIIDLLSLVGGLFLVWIGITCFRRETLGGDEGFSLTAFSIFKSAFLTGLTNPKDIIFFVAFLPQFLISDIPYWLAGLYLLIGWVCLDFSIMLCYGLLSKYYINMTHNNQGVMHIRMTSGVLMFLVGTSLSFTAINKFI